MAQPMGFTSEDKPMHICRLRNEIYGLKQAPRAWYNALMGYLLSIGFVKTNLMPHYLSDMVQVIRYSSSSMSTILLSLGAIL